MRSTRRGTQPVLPLLDGIFGTWRCSPQCCRWERWYDTKVRVDAGPSDGLDGPPHPDARPLPPALLRGLPAGMTALVDWPAPGHSLAQWYPVLPSADPYSGHQAPTRHTGPGGPARGTAGPLAAGGSSEWTTPAPRWSCRRSGSGPPGSACGGSRPDPPSGRRPPPTSAPCGPGGGRDAGLEGVSPHTLRQTT
jgi:hypothetical protein